MRSFTLPILSSNWVPSRIRKRKRIHIIRHIHSPSPSPIHIIRHIHSLSRIRILIHICIRTIGNCSISISSG